MAHSEKSAAPLAAAKARQTARAGALLSEFSSRLGREILNIRIYRDAESFVFERQIVERDGTSFTMVLPFRETATVRALLVADPYYERLQTKLGRASFGLEKFLWVVHGKSSA